MVGILATSLEFFWGIGSNKWGKGKGKKKGKCSSATKKIWEIMVNVASLSWIEKTLSREVIYGDDS